MSYSLLNHQFHIWIVSEDILPEFKTIVYNSYSFLFNVSLLAESLAAHLDYVWQSKNKTYDNY